MKKNLLIVLILSIFTNYLYPKPMKKNYKSDVRYAINRTKSLVEEILTKESIQNLPTQVKKYLLYVGVVGKPKVKNFKMNFSGQMRDLNKPWFLLESEQYNFFDQHERLFYMKGKMKGISAYGYHRYQNARAQMLVKVLGLFKVVDLQGPQMDTAETVTLFNDMCFFAPAGLIDSSIRWEEIDSLSVLATFTIQGISISARLIFNEKGQLINFISDDRAYRNADNVFIKCRFSTPVGNYKNIKGLNLPTYGEAIYHLPEGDFCYGKFELKNIEYNL